MIRGCGWRGGVVLVLVRADGEDEEEGGANMDWDLVRNALEDLHANPTVATFCASRPTDAETGEGNEGHSPPVSL
jgi:hypothetical protein